MLAVIPVPAVLAVVRRKLCLCLSSASGSTYSPLSRDHVIFHVGAASSHSVIYFHLIITFPSLINRRVSAPWWHGCEQGCLQLHRNFSFSLATATALHLPKGHGFLRNLYWEEFVLTVKTVYTWIPGKGCVWLLAAMPVLNPHTYQDFSLFTQMFFETKLEINFLWCWRAFFFISMLWESFQKEQ